MNSPFSLYVTATYDDKGQYSGNVLEWRDVTEMRKREIQDLDNIGQLAAINRSLGTIELGMDGKVLKVNDIFLNVLGYSAQEVFGKSHSDFVDSTYKNSVEYKQFWEKLNRGETISSQFKREGKAAKKFGLKPAITRFLTRKASHIKW